jgi:hypothetical protein
VEHLDAGGPELRQPLLEVRPVGAADQDGDLGRDLIEEECLQDRPAGIPRLQPCVQHDQVGLRLDDLLVRAVAGRTDEGAIPLVAQQPLDQPEKHRVMIDDRDQWGFADHVPTLLSNPPPLNLAGSAGRLPTQFARGALV